MRGYLRRFPVIPATPIPQGPQLGTMSTTPLLQSPVHSLADPALLPTYEVYLHRYILSYSASCPCLVQPIVQLFEKLLLPRWVSHYAISIRGNSSFSHNSGDRKFELRRVGYLPFGSVAFFTITDNGLHGNDLDEEETAPLIRVRAKSICEDEKIGTTFFRPDDIIHESTLPLMFPRMYLTAS